MHLVEAVRESRSNVFSPDDIWALTFLNEERRLGWGREEQKEGKIKEMWKLIPSTVKRSCASI